MSEDRKTAGGPPPQTAVPEQLSAPDQVSALREAMSDLERRQAQGDTGFFARLGEEAGETPAPAAPAPAASAGSGAGADSQGADQGAAAVEFADDPERAESYAKAKKTALNMLAMRDHSSTELREKLLRKEHAPEVVDRLLAKLVRSNLLDDAQFAQRFAKAQRESRKLSRSALRRQLSRKGIDDETITGVVENVDGGVEGEELLAREVAEKKARSTRGLDHEVRERRILGMLARRGFSSTICLKVTREVLAET